METCKNRKPPSLIYDICCSRKGNKVTSDTSINTFLHTKGTHNSSDESKCFFLSLLLCLTFSDEEIEEGNRLWDKYCAHRDDPEYAKRVYCNKQDGKVYYFEPDENKFAGGTNLREICRSKFTYNPGADMVSIMSCNEYKRFRHVVGEFVQMNKFDRPVTVYTSGYFSPSLAEEGKSGVYRWMKSGKETTEFFEGAPTCMDWNDEMETTSDKPLKLLTMEADGPNVRSK